MTYELPLTSSSLAGSPGIWSALVRALAWNMCLALGRGKAVDITSGYKLVSHPQVSIR